MFSGMSTVFGSHTPYDLPCTSWARNFYQKHRWRQKRFHWRGHTRECLGMPLLMSYEFISSFHKFINNSENEHRIAQILNFRIWSECRRMQESGGEWRRMKTNEGNRRAVNWRHKNVFYQIWIWRILSVIPSAIVEDRGRIPPTLCSTLTGFISEGNQWDRYCDTGSPTV